MKTTTHKLALILLVFFSINISADAQNSEFSFKDKLTRLLMEYPAEKLYMHTDRDIYSVDDSIWFKIYLTKAGTNIPVPGIQNVYVELINSSNNIVKRDLVASLNGFVHGLLNLNKLKLSEGNYQIRSYTQYQRNFGDEFLFSKEIRIKGIPLKPLNVFTELQESDTLSQTKHAETIDLQFLPEGGTFLAGIDNIVAFICNNAWGKPINISGYIEDKDGNKIFDFKSIHDGMGKFIIRPKEGKTYVAKVEGYPSLNLKLPKTSGDAQLSVSTERNDHIPLTIKLRKDHNSTAKLFIALSSNGIIYNSYEANVLNHQTKIHLPKREFMNGINQITITDSNMKPLAERLIFIKKNTPLLIEIKSDKTKYSIRDKVDVLIHSTTNSKPSLSNLSASVINAYQVTDTEEYPQNILSYLLLDSELKGKIKNPSYYFKDDSSSTQMKLDLLMLTHGWRSYVWNDLGNQPPTILYEKEKGIMVKGRVKRPLWEKGIEDGKVSMMVNSNNTMQCFTEISTNDSGYFYFPPAIFLDSSKVFIQAFNKRNKNNAEIVDVSTLSPPAPVGFKKMDSQVFNSQQEDQFAKMAYKRRMIDKAYHPEKYEILLGEITIEERLIPEEEKNDGHYRIYGQADNVIKMDDLFSTYSSIYEILDGQVPGVHVEGTKIVFSGAMSYRTKVEPLFVLDGMPADADLIETVPITEIDKIEILKTATKLAAFGSKGANGVIAIFTKRGKINTDETYYKGILTDKLRGYQKAKEFYSPNYINTEAEIPDHRATLYWNPSVVTDSTGTAGFSFYTSDDTAPMLIKLEGISENGIPGVGYLELLMGNEN